jgi:hypothetical protein
VDRAVGDPVEFRAGTSPAWGCRARVARVSASRTRSSESIRPATYIVVTGTSARRASSTELRPATISLLALFLRVLVRPPVAATAAVRRLGHLVRLVVRAVGRLGRRALALEPTAALTAGADLRALLARTAHRAAALGVTGHESFAPSPRQGPTGPGGGVLERDACGGELVADGIRGVVVTSGTGVGPGREAFLDE